MDTALTQKFPFILDRNLTKDHTAHENEEKPINSKITSLQTLTQSTKCVTTRKIAPRHVFPCPLQQNSFEEALPFVSSQYNVMEYIQHN